MVNVENSRPVNNNLRRLISIIDELRDIGLQQYVNLPRICVVGTQSAGKSSVLEAIVGLDFLPRGEGVVTRRPLELRLVQIGNSIEGESESWAVFENDKGRKYTNLEEVKEAIGQLTDKVAGKNRGIVDDPIVLTIYSQHCPDLTLIDLPGITRVPLKGSDQTDDIERLTREMAIRYAQDLRTIILAVVPANVDISTSDALQIARKVDPKGLRTIGVITKIDLMDKGTDASKMLLGEEVPLRLGYTGVRNRSQADILSKATIADAMKEEKKYFSTHPVYKRLPLHVLGTQALTDKLTRVLFRHIRTHLPDIRREISNRLRSIQARLDELGTDVPENTHEQIQLMWSMITDYCEIFRNVIRGKFDKKIQTYFDHYEVASGSQIRSIFNDLLENHLNRAVTAEMQDSDIDLAIRMHEGDALPGFPSSDTFEYLILPHLQKISSPVMDCLDRVSQALETLSQAVIARIFNRFPKLMEEITDKSYSILLREKDHTRLILENVVTAETGYLFTNDTHYLMSHGSMLPLHDKSYQEMLTKQTVNLNGQGVETISVDMANASQQSNAVTSSFINSSINAGNVVQAIVSGSWSGISQDKAKRSHYSASFIKEIRERLDAYYGIVLRNTRDIVPKIIGHFLVRQLQDKLQFELYHNVVRSENLSLFLGEPENIVEERTKLKLQISTLKKAVQVLQKDPGSDVHVANEFDDSFDNDLALQYNVVQNKCVQNVFQPPTYNQHTLPCKQTQPIPTTKGNVTLTSSHYPNSTNSRTNDHSSTMSNLWGERVSKKALGDRKPVALFGEQVYNNETNTNKPSLDMKIVNPLYS